MDQTKKLQKNTDQESEHVSSAEPCKKSGIVTASVSFSLRTHEMVWAKVHSESPEGQAFALLCLKKRMRKRDFRELQWLINKDLK